MLFRDFGENLPTAREFAVGKSAERLRQNGLDPVILQMRVIHRAPSNAASR